VEASGLVLRKTYPGHFNASATVDGAANDFHIDQDIHGKPFVTLVSEIPFLHSLFRLGILRLVNMWTPLASPWIRPLAVVDGSTVIPQRDLIRGRWFPKLFADNVYSKNFTSELFLWRYNSWIDYNETIEPRIHVDENMEIGQAIVFSTTDTLHSGIGLPGDDELSRLRLLISNPSNQTCEEEKQWLNDLLQSTINTMTSPKTRLLLKTAQLAAQQSCNGNLDFIFKQDILHQLMRVSLEMRLVILVIPNHFIIGLGVGLMCSLPVVFWMRKRR
jgi:hypothetical protein